MKQFSRGQKSKLADLGLSDTFAVCLDINAPGVDVDITCFGLDSAGKLSDDRYMIFYNQKSAPGNAITFSTQQNQSRFQTALSALPASIDKLVFCASTDAAKGMRALGLCQMLVGDGACFPFSGSDFLDEKAIIIGELYRREGSWRFGSVGQGFNGGLSALLKHFGGTEMNAPSTPAPTPATPPAPAATQTPAQNQTQTPAQTPAPAAKKISLSKITLEKRGDKISLEKQDKQAFGRIRVNLNWNQRTPMPTAPEKTGILNKIFGTPSEKNRQSNGIDLDLACLFEMADGRKSAVQALGETWGSYDHPPYIHLEGDDRTGAVTTGENIFINGAHFDKIKRILIYTFIYEGVPNWADTDGVVTVEIPGQPNIEVRLDNGTNSPMCAIALIENVGGNIQVTKLAEYFSGYGKTSAHEEMDNRYHFGLKWKMGSKD